MTGQAELTARLREQVQGLIDNKTKPLGALGALERLAMQIALLQQNPTPTMSACDLIIFIADHGITEEGVSAFPQSVTTQMALNFLHDGAAANVFAAVNDVHVQLVDAGMCQPPQHPRLRNCRIASGTHNFRRQPAMTRAQCEQALQLGAEVATATTSHALCLGEMGIGNTSSATLLMHKILGLPLTQLVGRGTGLDDHALAHKLAVLTDAAARTAPRLNALAALSEYGGFEIAMMAGAMSAAAAKQQLVLIDGFIATAAAVAALQINPAVQPALVFAHCSAESGHQLVLQTLDVQPLLNLQLRLGEGTGALLAWPLVKSSVAMLNDMASFADAGVDGPL
ncbi:MAG: nicotinate-nucleotide--dimethylbenzimidazole phosphoribosyltransferase [Pseudomonadota bacterium]